jgi:putative endonuclease
MPKPTRTFGRWGEDLAVEFLQRRRYAILERNFRRNCGEIDIIARRAGLLHFVEVKARTASGTSRFGLPQEAVVRAKQRKLLRTAQAYLAEKGEEGAAGWQFDVIAITYFPRESKADIRLIESAFDESAF